jgi:hypothetical protein
MYFCCVPDCVRMERQKRVVGKYINEYTVFRYCVCVDLNPYYVKYGCFNVNDTKQLRVANFLFRHLQ